MLDTKISTWNIHGKLADTLHQELLERDMITKGIDICCIQETRMNHDAEIQCTKGGVIINLTADSDNGLLCIQEMDEQTTRVQAIDRPL